MTRDDWLALLRRALPVWVLGLAIVGLAEGAARFTLGDDERWQYWNRTMATKVHMVRRAHAAGRTPTTLIVGDSSAAFNLQPAVLDRIAGTTSYNLGSAGNYASSFDITMTHGILPDLGFTPERLLVSFAGHGFNPEHLGQTRRILASPLGQRLTGERVWGDWFHLVRFHHVLRLLRDPPVHAAVRREKGFEPYAEALLRRRRRPGMARKLPPPPSWMVRTAPRQAYTTEDPMEPVRSLFRWAKGEGIQVVFISPPTDERSWIDDLDAVAKEFEVPHWDYSAAPYKQHLSHLSEETARRYSRDVGRRLKESL